MTVFFLLASAAGLLTALLVALPIIRPKSKSEEVTAPSARIMAIIVAGLFPVLGGGIYLAVGAPQAMDPAVLNAQAPDPAAAIAALPPEEREAAITSMVEGLAARLAADPVDLEGWRMLARSYAVLGRHEDSANAWREALVYSQGFVEDWRGLALALMQQGRAGDLSVGPAIREAFEEILTQLPEDPMALYFLGNAALANGDRERALKLFTALRAQAPEDAALNVELDRILEALAVETPAMP